MFTLPAEDNPLQNLATQFAQQSSESQYQKNRFARKQENIKNALAQFQDAEDISPFSFFQAINSVKDLEPEEKKSLNEAYGYYNEQKKMTSAQVEKQQKKERDFLLYMVF